MLGDPTPDANAWLTIQRVGGVAPTPTSRELRRGKEPSRAADAHIRADPGPLAQPLVLPVADGRHAPGDRSRPLRRLPRVLPRRAGFHESVGRGYAPDAPDAWRSHARCQRLVDDPKRRGCSPDPRQP